MRCSRCGVDGKIYKQKNANGGFVVVERCPKCGRNTIPGKPFLNKALYDWDNLPLFVDYNAEHGHPCDVKGCTRKDTEYHHFAPRSLFENADDWLTGWLCKFHHDLWHKLTKTGSYAPKPVRVKANSTWQQPH